MPLALAVILGLSSLVLVPSSSAHGRHRSEEIDRRWANIDESQPRGFRLSLTERPSEMMLSWTAPVTSTLSTLRYSVVGASGWHFWTGCSPQIIPLPADPTMATLRCTMTNLQPYTRYYYAIEIPGGFVPDDPLSFISAPQSGKAFSDYPLRILAFGDVDWTDGKPGDPPGSNPLDVGNSNKVSEATCKDFTVGREAGPGHPGPRSAFNATLTLHVGDISYSGPNSGGNRTLGGTSIYENRD